MKAQLYGTPGKVSIYPGAAQQHTTAQLPLLGATSYFQAEARVTLNVYLQDDKRGPTVSLGASAVLLQAKSAHKTLCPRGHRDRAMATVFEKSLYPKRQDSSL